MLPPTDGLAQRAFCNRHGQAINDVTGCVTKQVGSIYKEINMGIREMLKTAEFVVDAQGNNKAMLVDYKVWEELLTLLEDWEDIEELHRLREAGEEAIPWEQAKAELRAEGIDV